MADDAGRLLCAPKAISGDVFPHDDDITAVEVESLLQELVGVGSVVLYEAAGVRYGVLPGFSEHQKIGKPVPSRLPPPPEGTDLLPGIPWESLGIRGIPPPEVEVEVEVEGNTNARKRASIAAIDRFEEFWKVFPIHRDRSEAEKAWRKAITTTDPDIVIAGAARYAAEMSLEGAPRPKYGQGWLNGRRWEDEPQTGVEVPLRGVWAREAPAV